MCHVIDCGCVRSPHDIFYQCSDCGKTFCERHWQEGLREDQTGDERLCGVCWCTLFDKTINKIILKYCPRILETTAKATIRQHEHNRNAELVEYILDSTAGRVARQQQGSGPPVKTYVFSGMQPRAIQLEASKSARTAPYEIDKQILTLIANLAASVNAHFSQVEGGS